MRQGLVFDIQHYAVHDGPGIRTVVFLKGCPLRCAWCCNPESQRFAPELRHTAARCRACLECRKVCPGAAIGSSNGKPVFNRQRCCACNASCVEACPHGALAVVGEWMTPDTVMARVAADKPFYDNSGGGVTFSGGEPFAQPEFLEELLDRSKLLGIHTAVETCGHAHSGALARCEPLVDLFLYDLKLMDGGRHNSLTGVSNALILENLRALAAKSPRKLAVRVPVVPGCTADSGNLEAIGVFLVGLGLAELELMPYHPLGADKYLSFGRRYALDASEGLTDAALAQAARVLELSGIACHWQGEQVSALRMAPVDAAIGAPTRRMEGTRWLSKSS